MTRPPTSDDLVSLGLDACTAAAMAEQVAALWSETDPARRWSRIARNVLSPATEFSVHRALFARNYQDGATPDPPPAWIPDASDIERANLTSLMRSAGAGDLEQLARWARTDAAGFWGELVERLRIRFRRAPDAIVDLSAGMEHPRWLPGARMNIAESCLMHPAALLLAGDEAGRLRQLACCELAQQAARFAGALRRRGLGHGAAVALVMPVSIEAVITFLGTILAGATAVCIAESFVADEVLRRVEIGRARLLVTQHTLLRGGKRLPLYAKLRCVDLPAMVVVSSEQQPAVGLRSMDAHWDDFMAAEEAAAAAPCDPRDVSTILFSSGTTAEPKAVPWTHTTPIQCAADGYLYQDLHAEDVLCWPTSMGWMMGPWLIYAGLINGASIALFDGHAGTQAFVRFVERVGVTVLGVVPSLVAAWQATNVWEAADWSCIRLFSSTGECSQAEAMLALSARAGYRPVIEYCGGTEIGGGYITSTVLRPWAPACFNQLALGLDVVIVDEFGRPADRGEAFLSGASIGLSTTLLNGDHQATYYGDTPRGAGGQRLRRHGDVVEVVTGGYYRVLGRADDAMNLGGIKVAAVEIERVANEHPAIAESAAIAVTDSVGGPARLVLFYVAREPTHDVETLRDQVQRLLRQRLNPLFRLSQIIARQQLPRTASNKLLRRVLRDEATGNARASAP